MIKEQVKFQRKLNTIGTSMGITIPSELQDFLEIEKNSELEMVGDSSKHGKFIAIWKKE